MGNTDTAGKSAKPTSHRYTDAEKDGAVRLVRQLRKELGTSRGTVKRVAEQLGCGVESLRQWVKQADIDDGTGAGAGIQLPRRRSTATRAGRDHR